MEKLVHTHADVAYMLASFEEAEGMSSDEFYALYQAGRRLEMPRFRQHVWASFYRELERLDDAPAGEFAARATDTLALPA